MSGFSSRIKVISVISVHLLVINRPLKLVQLGGIVSTIRQCSFRGMPLAGSESPDLPVLTVNNFNFESLGVGKVEVYFTT